MTKYILRSLIRFFVTLVAQVKVVNKEKLPKSGSYAFATNHLGFIDATLAYYILNRWDFFIPIAEKWGEYTFLRWLGKHLNIIFIDRFNSDIHALRQILRRMAEGQVLVIAPEGTRSRNEKMVEAKPGVSYLASKAKFPIIPVALAGTEDRILFGNLKRLKRTKVTVTIGEAFTLPPLPKENRDEVLKEYTDEIMCRIAAMLPEKNRGFYAEHARLAEILAN
ncbi:MAG: 1-acyl-sn-glycerol-3-phosphate acyltransferase [Anaerolineales bacterium]|uniref:1-acyl-sn-glycerol-3-phosphate acyltransferase n=1 Tax=Candidatus Desulfolinea nitratireducens TaxID=2841698 RepID=A0A8J6NL17_9CHLR|nr:1-acyl-sn-glycerol-3-phosphate acyltransferase [Candidatus Desulfolinea nitratireducens]MBL6959713.1 1-acyl-sn-glycerol-3-phosphate acyltransferase [Anaerolineales bacterium]